jgi:hypothetical protein
MRRRRPLALAAAVAALLAIAAPARADTSYYVAAPAADSGGSCAPDSSGGFYQCTTLRAAVTTANATPGADTITIGAGTYPLSSQLTLSDNVNVGGVGARSTIISPSNVRGFSINGNVTVSMALLTVQNGNAASGEGGNILNAGDLTLTYVRLTGGSAFSGGGLATDGDGASATILLSLIDHNSGAGIVNRGQTNPSTLDVWASTVAFNSGGGIVSGVNGTDDVTLYEDTIARNTGAGLTVTTGTASSLGSIIANNTPNCSGTTPTDDGGNLEDAATCRLAAASSNRNPGLGAALENQGGQTDVLTIPAGSPAIDLVQPCYYPIDQRGEQRAADFTQPCDAGAYEQSPYVAPPTPPPPVPPAPTPPANAPLSAVPTPVPGQTVVAKEVSGKVRVKLPGTNTFVELDGTQGIPVGSTVDAKAGRLELTALQKAGAAPEKALFYDGVFKVTQTKTTTDLTLNETLAKCSGSASAAAKKPKARKLWGNGSGSFRTRGQYSAATVRGTEWLVQDSCAGTLTQVKKGVVSVRDNVKNKTILLKAGKKYLARPKR